jgi:hypothetical protein
MHPAFFVRPRSRVVHIGALLQITRTMPPYRHRGEAGGAVSSRQKKNLAVKYRGPSMTPEKWVLGR